jgi:hypothetical protein
MKNMKLFFTFLVAGIFLSCKKNVSTIYYEGGTAPVITASSSNVSLEPGNEANTALVISWTNPDYKFTTGPNSHDVTYTLEMDTLGANFGSSKKVATVISKDLSKTYTVGQLNAILGNDMVLQLNPRRNYTLQLRVSSSIGTAVKLTSNVISFTTKPFAPPPKVNPPTAGTLWITGDAIGTPGFPAWSNPIPSPYDVSLKFTQVSSTLYTLIVDLKTTGGYKLIQEQGNWATQFHMVAGGTALAGTFVQENADPTFPAPSIAGSYKLTFDFQLGLYTAVKQ